MNSKEDIELVTLKRFVSKERKARILALLKDRNVGEGFGYLAHFSIYLDMRFFTQVPSMASHYEIDYILDMIKKHTLTGKCYVMSEDKILDGKEMRLKEALNEVVGKGIGSLLIIANGKIVYYEGEGTNERYLGIRLND